MKRFWARRELERIKELEEQLADEAIGNAKTVKQVKAIVCRYKKQFPPIIVSSTPYSPYDLFVPLFVGNEGRIQKSAVEKAAETKIKRLNRDIVIKNCECLEHAPDDAGYAHVMMSMMKEIAGKEVDGTRILKAKKAGLDPMSVFKSMLAIYNVKQDDVM